MADIKTREVSKGTIRTLDRASSMTHRIKTASVRAKDEMVQERKSDENSSSFATGKVTRAGERSAVAAGGTTETLVRRAYRDYGEKKLRKEAEGRKVSSRIRGAETRAEADRVNGNRVHTLSGRQVKGRKDASYSLKSPKSANSREVSYTLSQRNNEIQRLRSIKKKMTIGENRRFFSKSIRRTGSMVKKAAAGTKSLITIIAAAGSSVVLVIVICIFLTASIFLFGQDIKDEFSAEELGTGDTLIVRVASAQIGNVGGLKFAKWYGFSGRVEWCACFVSWCANQCGYIDKGIIPKFAVVGDGADWFKARGRFQSNKYIPHPGDIIFFDWGADGTRDHVGFVERCDGKMVYTIEGNSGDTCRRLAYRVGYPEIYGYGIPAYPVSQSSIKDDK